MEKTEDIRPLDHYALLSVAPSAAPIEIKAAYHRALLAYHPDKHSSGLHEHVDIDMLKNAFHTLSTPHLRKAYDEMRVSQGKQSGPRPAQVISLEDFQEVSDVQWSYTCRCGGAYIVTEEMLDAGQHIVGCSSCSEVVWVGYELVAAEEDVRVQ